MAHSTLCWILTVVLLLATACRVRGDEWRAGRGSFYGLDGWSIHHGNCGFGYQYPDIGTGWDVAALADAAPEFSGSCGKCFEVKCDPKYLHDGYGTAIDRRSGVCYDPNKSIVVRIVDSCPCYYPTNAYSNKRWCCGDNGVSHFDLSVWAYEKLADKKWGVIGLKYRPVPCTYTSSNPAAPIANPSPGEAPPAGAKRPTDYIYAKRTDPTGQPQGAVKAVTDDSQAYGASHVSFDSLFSGGGAFNIDYSETNNAFAATKLFGGNPFGGSSSFASASASASSGGSAFASASFSSSGGMGSISIPGLKGDPLVMAFGGPSESDDCSDNAPPGGFSCQQQKDFGKCSSDFLVTGNYCAATCGRCSSQQAPASSGSSCSNNAPPGGFSCQQQKDFGKCSSDFLVNGNYCAATCGRCSSQQQAPPSSGSGCSDNAPPGGFSCQQQKDFGKCSSDFLVNGNYCAATCGRCTSSAPSQQQAPASSSGSGCSDNTPPGGFSCQQQKDFGKCSSDFLVAGNYCSATCGRCGSSTPSQQPAPKPAPASNGGGAASSSTVYFQGFQNGWGSWGYSSSFKERSRSGVNGDQAVCGAIYTYGAFQAGNAAAGGASSKSALQLWVDNPTGLTINLGSASATCTAKSLSSIGASEQQAGFSKFWVPLNSLGCPFGADQITRVTLANAQQQTLNLCISDVRFV